MKFGLLLQKILMLTILVSVMVPASGQIAKKAEELAKKASTSSNDGLSTDEVSSGLKQALLKGVEKSASEASKEDGFYLNKAIKIPFPEDAKNVASALKDIGMQEEVKSFVMTLNRSAELAAAQAKPIFVNAVKEMTIDDVWSILNGEDKEGATNYLREKTADALREKMQPIIEAALKETSATSLYEDLINAYNKLPFARKKDPDLVGYATEKTLEGLFYLVGQEERKIREDPAERTTDILKKVFN